MADAADRGEHGGDDVQSLDRLRRCAPDVLQRAGAAGVFLRIDAEALQRRRHRSHEGLAGAGVKHPADGIERHQAGADQGGMGGFAGEPAQMRVVEQAGVLVAPVAGEQAVHDAPVFDVGHADQNDAAGIEQGGVASQDRPGVA